MSVGRLKLMGILNATPDSFYDGGKYFSLNSARKQAEKMAAEGADILDVGGVSTRPGSLPVPEEEELKRVVPLVRMLVKKLPGLAVSVDTQDAEVAYRSLSEGARIVNDISALRSDGRMADVVRQFNAGIILMHMRGEPLTMQNRPRYRNVVREIKKFLAERLLWATQNGLSKKKIWIDPGIGFGKTVAHNLKLIKHIKDFISLGCPLVMGCSRKSFIGKTAGFDSPLPPEERLEGSLAVACWSFLEGVSVLRVHDVGASRKALQMVKSIQES